MRQRWTFQRVDKRRGGPAITSSKDELRLPGPDDLYKARCLIVGRTAT